MRPKGIHSFAVNPGLIPSHLHDPEDPVVMRPEDFEMEPRMRTEFVESLPNVQFDASGLATGTFVSIDFISRLIHDSLALL